MRIDANIRMERLARTGREERVRRRERLLLGLWFEES
jgi:hypothetical protein